MRTLEVTPVAAAGVKRNQAGVIVLTTRFTEAVKTTLIPRIPQKMFFAAFGADTGKLLGY